MQRRLSAAIAVLAAGLSSPAVADLPFDQFIAFGASYDDSGQFPDPAFGYDTGLRFTNIDPATGARGLSMPEWVAANLGIGQLTPSMPITAFGPRTDAVDTQNINFAVGGYRAEDVLASVTGTQSISVGAFNFQQPGFRARLAAGSLAVGPNTLYYALPAGNDIRDLDDPVQTAAVSAQVVQALVDAGARYIVLPTLPQLGSFAERANYDADGRSALGIARSEASIAFNEAFQQQLSGMQGNFIRVDVTRLFEEVLANPAAFGYPLDIDQTRACFDAAAAGGPGCDEPAGRGRSSGGNADDFVFNDGLHPTQSSARGAADLIASVIQAPGIFALVPESVLGEARAFQNTLDSHFVQTRWEVPAEGWQVFASVQGASVDIAEGGATPAADSDSTDLTLGVSRGIGGGWSVGAAIGSQSTDSDIDLQGSELSTEGLIGSLFASYRQGDWFADLALGFGATDVDDIDRVFGIGPVQVRREHGETDADVTTLGADVGVDMTAAGTPLRFGPFLGLEYVEVEVDGYAEDGSSSSAMRFDDYERESLQGRAGVFASYPVKLGGATLDLHADVAYVEEFEGDTDDVVAVGNTLASGPWFRMPGYTIDDNGLRVAVGADASWASGVRVGLGYRYDDNDAEAGYLNLNASYAF